MCSLLAAAPDKCVYGMFHVCKPLHKLLSKINKRRAERDGGGAMKGRREKNTEHKPYVMLQKALENAFNLSVNIQRAGLYMPSLKRGRFLVYLS